MQCVCVTSVPPWSGSSLLVKESVEKLPSNQKFNQAMSQREERLPVVKSFSDWLYKIAEAARTVTPQITNPGEAVIAYYCKEAEKMWIAQIKVLCYAVYRF